MATSAVSLFVLFFGIFPSLAKSDSVFQKHIQKFKNGAGSSGNLGVSTSQIFIVQPDPGHKGHFLWKIWASGANITNLDSQTTGVLRDVTIILYEKGIAAARLQAPAAEGNFGQRKVTASGGVTIHSLVETGTTLTADKIIWHEPTGKVLATGHVFYHSGTSGMDVHTNGLVMDTELKTLSSSEGGRIDVKKGF